MAIVHELKLAYHDAEASSTLCHLISPLNAAISSVSGLATKIKKRNSHLLRFGVCEYGDHESPSGVSAPSREAGNLDCGRTGVCLRAACSCDAR